jgi:hypothetical protein
MTTQAQPQDTAALVDANVFELKHGKTHITFQEEGLSGKPRLEVRTGEETRTFTGDQIRQESTALGRLLTVDRVLVDIIVDWFTVVLPEVRVESGKTETFSTLVIYVRHPGLTGPLVIGGTGPGADKTYEAQTYRGTASHFIRQTLPR